MTLCNKNGLPGTLSHYFMAEGGREDACLRARAEKSMIARAFLPLSEVS
jgi:hypothetical protein